MVARAQDMKRILAMAMVDENVRRRLVAEPDRVGRDLEADLDDAQIGLLREVGSRLAALDLTRLTDMMSLEREIDLITGNPIGPVAGHASSSVSW